jgi:hypothetical protein
VTSITVGLDRELESTEWRASEELHEASRLARPCEQQLVLLDGDHNHGIGATARDHLWPNGPSSAKHFTELGFGGLQLPGRRSERRY